MNSIGGSSNSDSSYDILPSDHVLEKVAAEVDLILQIATALDQCLGTALEELPALSTQASAVQDLDLLVQSLDDVKRVIKLLATNGASEQRSLASVDVKRAVKLEAIRERLTSGCGHSPVAGKKLEESGSVELF